MCARGLFCSEKLNPLRELSLSVFKFSERSALFFHGLSVFRLFSWLFVHEAVIFGLFLFFSPETNGKSLRFVRSRKEDTKNPTVTNIFSSYCVMWSKPL